MLAGGALASDADTRERNAAFAQGLQQLGWIEGRNVQIDYRWAANDPELIRKVIRDHADQVRYCYEQQLTLNPKLGGKIAIKWQINADGHASATIFDSNVPVDSDGMRNVGECIMSRIKSWEFPKPKGGGMAIVTYPWILRSSGSGSAG